MATITLRGAGPDQYGARSGETSDVQSKSSEIKLHQTEYYKAKDMAEAMLQEAQLRQEALHHTRRTRFWRRRGGDLQQFSKSVADFLTAFRGVVAFLAQADNAYGNVACAAIYTFLEVGRNKQVEEDIITKTIESSAVWLKRISELNNTFREDLDLVSLCEAICSTVTSFMKRSVDYYKKSTGYRVYKAITTPPHFHTREFADRMRAQIDDLMHYHSLLLGREVKKLTSNLHDTDVKVTFMHLGQMKVAENGARDCRADIAKTLRLPWDRATDKMIQSCKESYEHIPQHVCKSGNPQFRRPLQQATLDMLQSFQEYQDWETDPSSSLLILQGENGAGGNPFRSACWLSPLAVQLYDNLSESSTQISKIFTSVPHCNVPSTRKKSIPLANQVLSTLLYQLLALRDGQLWETQKHYITNQQSSRGCDSDTEDQCELLYDLFESCLKELKKSGCAKLYVIINELGRLRDENTHDLLRRMSQLTLRDSPSDVVVKVMVVADGCKGQWKNSDLEPYVSRKETKHVYTKLDWLQEEYSRV